MLDWLLVQDGWRAPGHAVDLSPNQIHLLAFRLPLLLSLYLLWVPMETWWYDAGLGMLRCLRWRHGHERVDVGAPGEALYSG